VLIRRVLPQRKRHAPWVPLNSNSGLCARHAGPWTSSHAGNRDPQGSLRRTISRGTSGEPRMFPDPHPAGGCHHPPGLGARTQGRAAVGLWPLAVRGTGAAAGHG
jgi:hypothetical protein